MEIKKAEDLPPKPFLEWPEYLESINVIDVFNTKERKEMNKRLEIE